MTRHLTHRLNPKGESPLYVGPVADPPRGPARLVEGGSASQECASPTPGVPGQTVEGAAPLKNKRAAILAYIVHFQAEAGYPPTILEIGTALGLGKSTVHYHLCKLEQQGIIERQGHSARAMKVL